MKGAGKRNFSMLLHAWNPPSPSSYDRFPVSIIINSGSWVLAVSPDPNCSLQHKERKQQKRRSKVKRNTKGKEKEKKSLPLSLFLYTFPPCVILQLHVTPAIINSSGFPPWGPGPTVETVRSSLSAPVELGVWWWGRRSRRKAGLGMVVEIILLSLLVDFT